MVLSLRRYYRERWWQRRFDGCPAVIEAIHDLGRYTDIEYKEIFEGRTFDKKWKEAAGERYSEASRLLRRYSDLGPLALPPKVAALLKAHYDEVEEFGRSGEHVTIDEHVEWRASAEYRLLSAVVPAAMDGLGLDRPWFRYVQ